MKKIRINTLGCKVNQYESASFQSAFEELGHHIVSSGTDADVVVINTCSVTGKAGAQSRQEIRKAIRQNPTATILITGCHAQTAGDELSAMVELQNRSVRIIGNGDKHLLVDAALEEQEINLPIHARPIGDVREISILPVKSFANRTRAYLRIQDGCNSFCSYCIVPYARGRSRSLSVDKVLSQARTFAQYGYKEIVITGIHVGSYGTDLQKNITISGILEKLCKTTPQVRYRLSSIEPLEISENLLDVMTNNDNFMPHLHIPLQSGNDDILLRMNRRYTTGRFAEILRNCQKKIEGLAIGLDILTGFPGETENLFNATLSFLESLDFTYLHVFPYSRRPGTPAATFPGQIERHIKENRVAVLRDLADKKKEVYYKRFLNTERTVLVEGKRNRSGELKGFTDNYIPVVFKGDDSLNNSLAHIMLESFCNNHVRGRLIMENNER